MKLRSIIGTCIVLTACAVLAIASSNSLTINGSVNSMGPNPGDNCSQSSSSRIFSLYCLSSDGQGNVGEADLTANVGYTGGGILGHDSSRIGDPPVPPYSGSYQVSLFLSGTYMLTGGHGVGDVTLTLEIRDGEVPNEERFILDFDGQHIVLDYGSLVQTTFALQYNVPYFLSLEYFGQDQVGPFYDYEVNSDAYYDFRADNLGDQFAPVPESGSATFLVIGVLGTACTALRRNLFF